MRACARWPTHADPVTLAVVPPTRSLWLVPLLVLPGSCNRLSDVAAEVVISIEIQADYDADARGLVLAQFVPDSPPQHVGVLCEPQAAPVRFAVNYYARDYPDIVDVMVWIVPLAPDESPTACGQLSGNTYDLVREFDPALPHGSGEIAVDIGCNLEEEGRAEVTINPASP
jgi:hypothetical protein